MAKMGTEIGWGNFRVIEFNSQQKQLIMEVTSSPFAQASKPSEKPSWSVSLLAGFVCKT